MSRQVRVLKRQVRNRKRELADKRWEDVLHYYYPGVEGLRYATKVWTPTTVETWVNDQSQAPEQQEAEDG